MITVKNLTFQYPTAKTNTLENISFSVNEGDVLGIVGPSGSGKTSLAMALAGHVPDVTGGSITGTITVAGRDPREDYGTYVGMIFEDYSSQLTQVRVIDEVTVPLLSRGLSGDEARKQAKELLANVQLKGYENKKTWELSGGEQQRVAIAAILAIDPDVLIFDNAIDM
ncbi:MAG: ATP-binding cassette domain-containing protein, partial [Halobacteriaceae archaeon]